MANKSISCLRLLCECGRIKFCLHLRDIRWQSMLAFAARVRVVFFPRVLVIIVSKYFFFNFV